MPNDKAAPSMRGRRWAPFILPPSPGRTAVVTMRIRGATALAHSIGPENARWIQAQFLRRCIAMIRSGDPPVDDPIPVASGQLVVICSPGSSIERVMSLADTLRTAADEPIPVDGDLVRLTLSIDVVYDPMSSRCR